MRFLLSTVFFFALSFSVHAQDWAYETLPAPDGVPLVVAETGTPNGPAILFIHGYSQSLLSWKKQLSDPMLRDTFRMVAFDLRGHGASGKPWIAEDYTSADWGGDVAHVIAEKGLDKPVLVGWSMGASVISAYVRHYGTDDIGGIVFVAGALSLAGRQGPPNPDDMPPDEAETMRTMMQMMSPDISANIAGTSGFVGRLAAVPLDEALMEEALIYNMMLPAYARNAMFASPTSYEDLAGKIAAPALLIHGDVDALVDYQVALDNQPLIPGSRLITYEGIGHAPFLEAPERFNQDVADFVSEVTKN